MSYTVVINGLSESQAIQCQKILNAMIPNLTVLVVKDG